MSKITLIIVSLVGCFTHNVLAASFIASRTFSSCGYVGGQIYCFGGDTTPGNSSIPTLDGNIYSLNIEANAGKKTESMISQWNKILPFHPFETGQRLKPISIVLSDGKRLMIQGGFNPSGLKYLDQTIIYDTSANTWSKSSEYTVTNGGIKQIFGSTAVDLQSGSIGFYGGMEQLTNVSGNGNADTFDSKSISYVGYNSFSLSNFLGIWSFVPQASTLLDFNPHHQTATINHRTGKVYYLGGTTTTSKWEQIKIPFNWATVFNTGTATWSNETFGGDIPSNRIHHTANLFPNSQDIILYGGSEDGQSASDNFCYTLNLETNTWTICQDIDIPGVMSAPRFGHSAVLVDTTLFILFGRGASGTLDPSLITLDVENVSNIRYAATYGNETSNTSNSNSNGTDSNDSDSDGSGKLSNGAVGGITAGAALAGLGIIAFVIFYLRRQKKSKQEDTEEESHEDTTEDTHVDPHEVTHEDMVVDWDKIEDHYREDPTTKSKFPRFTEITNLSARHYSPNLTEDSSYPKNKNPDIAVNAVKPSVSSVDTRIIIKPEKPDSN